MLVVSTLVAFADNDPGYYFTNYNVEMTVKKDNKYLITEDIDVYFTDRSHGIFRMIPTYVWVKRDVSEAQDGSETKMMHYKVCIDDVDVSENWDEDDETNDSLYCIRIGSADVMLPEGPHSYKITYTLQPYDDRIEQSDLFYYSILGNGWNCKTEHFTFKINFESAISEDELNKLKVFAGPLGSNYDYSDEILTDVTDKSIAGALDNIRPYNAITIFLPLHEGYFEKGTHPALDITLCWVMIAIASLCMIYVLFKEFFHNDKVTTVLSYYPPKGLSSADIGTIIDTSVDECDIISLIPWFAEQGYIEIDNTGANPVLYKVKDLPDDAPKYQKVLFDGFFKSGNKFDLKSVPKSFGDVWMKCEKELNSKFDGKLDYVDMKSVGVLVVAVLAISFANFFAMNDGNAWVWGGLTTFVFLGVACVQIWSDKEDSSAMSRIVVIVAIVGALGFLLSMMMVVFFMNDDGSYMSRDLMYGINIVMGIACIYAYKLNLVSKYRKEHLGEILGLYEFISTSEKQQLEHLQAQDEKYFYTILPYAVAFGMADTWAKKFAGINIPPVSWYKGTPDNYTMGLAGMMVNSHMTKAIDSSVKEARRAAAAAAARSSSGSSYSSSSSYSSGGGGYSGGGFGGGGGGRW